MGGIAHIQLSILNERCYVKEESVNYFLQDAFSLRNILSKFLASETAILLSAVQRSGDKKAKWSTFIILGRNFFLWLGCQGSTVH